jgi:hypothetical protein
VAEKHVIGVHIADRPALEEFVEPDVSADADAGGTAPVVLVSAAAAVGKTTLAEEIVRRRGAPLWRLGQFPLVGTLTVSGSIGVAYGLERVSEVSRALRDRQLTLVLDGLDEAVVNAGYGVIDAFAEDLATLAGENARHPIAQFVVLARPDTIKYLRDALAFTEPRLDYDMFVVRPLNRPAAVELVRKSLEVRSRVSNRLTPPGAFDSAMEAIWLEFARVFSVEPDALFEDEEARSFVGYPPVLIVLAEYLERCQLRPSLSGTSELGSLFTTIMRDTILAREQGKIIDNLPTELRPLIGTAVAGAAWLSPEHQMELLVAPGPSRALTPPEGFPTSRAAELLDAALAQLAQHPFLSDADGALDEPLGERFKNVAFRDYAIASVMTTTGDNRPASAVFMESGGTPSPLLARLLVSTGRLDDRDLARVSVEWLPFIHASIMAEAARRNDAWSTRMSVVPSDPDVALVILGPADGGLEFEVEDLEIAEVVLLGQLSDAEIDLHDGVDIRLSGIGPSRGLILGPGVALAAGRITFDARELRVLAARGGLLDPVEVRAVTLDVEDPMNFKLAALWPPEGVRPEEAFRLFGSASDYRLAPYVRDPIPGDNATWPPSELMQVRRIVKFIIGPANRVEAPVRTRAAKGSLSEPMLEFLLEKGVLASANGLIEFDADRAGFSLQQIITLDEPSSALHQLAADFRASSRRPS